MLLMILGILLLIVIMTITGLGVKGEFGSNGAFGPLKLRTQIMMMVLCFLGSITAVILVAIGTIN